MSKKKRKKRLHGKHNPRLSRKELKQKAVDYKGGCCQICQYNKCLANLSFHHRDPSKKEFGISRLISSLPWEVIEQELNNGVVLVCIRCHVEIHQGLIDGYMDIDGYS